MRADSIASIEDVAALEPWEAAEFILDHRADYAIAAGLATYHGLRTLQTFGRRREKHEEANRRLLDRAASWEGRLALAVGLIDHAGEPKLARKVSDDLALACRDSFLRACARANRFADRPSRYEHALVAGRN